MGLHCPSAYLLCRISGSLPLPASSSSSSSSSSSGGGAAHSTSMQEQQQLCNRPALLLLQLLSVCGSLFNALALEILTVRA